MIKANLYKHQQEMVEWLKSHKNGLLAAKVGTGKTLTVLSYFDYLKKHDKVDKLYVLGPINLLYDAWECDVEKFTDYQCCNLRTGKFNPDADVYLYNYESFWRSSGRAFLKQIIESGRVMIACDEVSKMKNNKSKITKQLIADRSMFSYRVGASGTPAPNTELEYWSTCHFLTPGVLPENFYVFRNNFFCLIRGKSELITGNMGSGAARDLIKKGFKYALHPKMQDELTERLKRCVIFVDNDVLDLPPKTDVVRSVTLTTDEMRVYNDMKKHCLVELRDDTITASTALTKIMKLRQATSGFMYNADGDPKNIETVPSKIKELLNIVNDSHEQMIIFSSFKHEIREVAKHLSKIAPTVTAFSDAPDTVQAIKDFKSGKAHYIVAHPLTIGHGVTLTNCQTIVFMSLDYSYEMWEQTRGRTHRNTQTLPCTNIVLIAPGTIDRAVYRCVESKGDKQKILDEFKFVL